MSVHSLKTKYAKFFKAHQSHELLHTASDSLALSSLSFLSRPPITFYLILPSALLSLVTVLVLGTSAFISSVQGYSISTYFSSLLTAITSSITLFYVLSVIVALFLLLSFLLVFQSLQRFALHGFFNVVILYQPRFICCILYQLTSLLLLFLSLLHPFQLLKIVSFVFSIFVPLAFPFFAISLLNDLHCPSFIVTCITDFAIAKFEKCHKIDTTSKKFALNKRHLVNSILKLSSIFAINSDQQTLFKTIDSLSFICLTYGLAKVNLPSEFFEVSFSLRSKMDMNSLSVDSIARISKQQTWLEWLVLRRYQSYIQQAVATGQPNPALIAHISRHLRRIAVASIYRKDIHVFDLCVRFFNTFIRVFITSKDLRSISNVLFEYRNLGSKTLFISSRLHHQLNVRPNLKDSFFLPDMLDSKVVTIGQFLRYYSIVCLESDIGTVSEVIAHDCGYLVAEAFKLRRSCHDDLLALFLTIDDTAETTKQVTSLRGIRRAQIKLAVSYLVHGQMRHARLIQQDMNDEPHERLQSIWQELTSIQSQEFYEISDRGSDDNYLTDQQKEKLPLFFSFFKGLSLPSESSEQLDIEKEIKSFRVQGRTLAGESKSLTDLNIPNSIS
ncbi:hypothetical protein GEMRC1_000541 [Eukaryota sp. GEM-RC1]